MYHLHALRVKEPGAASSSDPHMACLLWTLYGHNDCSVRFDFVKKVLPIIASKDVLTQYLIGRRVVLLTHG